MPIPVQLIGEEIDWPAWFQAGGSVVAIYLAARLVRLERLHQDVASMEAFRGVVYAAKALVDEASAAAEFNVVGQFKLNEVQTSRFKDVTELLGSTPTFELGSTKAAFELLTLKEDVRRLTAIRRAYGDSALPAAAINEVRLIQQRTGHLSNKVDVWLAGRRWRRAWWWSVWTPKRT